MRVLEELGITIQQTHKPLKVVIWKRMATSVSNPKFSSHSRSVSLPTSSHPLITNAEHHLRILKSCEGASWSSYTSTSQKFDCLRNLYECLDDVLQLPKSQQFLSRERSGSWEDEILDGSLRLLDICNTTRDAYALMKKSVQELESSLRRKRGSNLDKEVDAYMVSKKKSNRVVSKCLKETKRADNSLINDNSEAPLVKQIKEAQEITLTLLQSTLSFISEPQTKSWSLVSKWLQQNKVKAEVSEIRSMEMELMLLASKKSSNDLVRTQDLVKRLGELGSSIQEMVEALDDVFKVLLKARVSLLNILDH